jgi:preprotein translocase subunit YajC
LPFNVYGATPHNVAIGAAASIVRANFGGGTGISAATAGPIERHKGRPMLISPAYAQGAPGGGSDFLIQLLPFILIFVIMYFLILRPQQKRVKQHQEMVKNVRRGDTVVTSGGLVGKVTKLIDDEHIEVEVAEGVRVKQIRGMISDVRAKGEPVKDTEGAGAKS